MFEERLKTLRYEHQMSQKVLAEKLFVSQQAVAKWENPSSKASPNPDTLMRIADLFDVSVDYLLGKTDQKNSPAPDRASEEELQKLRELVKELSPQQQEELYRYGKYLASQRREE